MCTTKNLGDLRTVYPDLDLLRILCAETHRVTFHNTVDY